MTDKLFRGIVEAWNCSIGYLNTNHIGWRYPGIVIWLLIIIAAMIYIPPGKDKPFFSFFNGMVAFLFFTAGGILSYFLTSLFPKNKIVLTEHELTNVPGIWGSKTYALSSLSDSYVEISKRSKGKLGLRKMSSVQTMIWDIFWGWQLIDFFFCKHQQLILLGQKGEIVGKIWLSDYYEQDIAELVSCLKKRISLK